MREVSAAKPGILGCITAGMEEGNGNYHAQGHVVATEKKLKYTISSASQPHV